MPFAAGVLSIRSHVSLQASHMSTWMRRVPTHAYALFVIRDANRPTHREGDFFLYVNVSGDAAGERHGRISATVAWFKYAHDVLQKRWIVKMDDDVYLRPRSYAKLLRQLDDSRPVYFGNTVWHAYDRRLFAPKSFSFGYTRDEWRTFVDGRVNSTACDRSPLACPWCTSRSDCVPSFPFVTGWAIALSRPLVEQLLASNDVLADVERAAAERSSRDQIFEDVWLGSIIHTYAHHVQITQMSHHFWCLGSAYRAMRGREGNYPTTVVWHHKNVTEAHTRLSHTAQPIEPVIKCGLSENGIDAYLIDHGRGSTYCKVDDAHMMGVNPPEAA